jgi:iron-sulfur cluster repair protein YtfE (RIC family)
MNAEATAISPEHTVNEVVQRYPSAITVLAAYGIDTCCGGKHPVAEAARRHQVDVQDLLEQLVAAAAADRAHRS